MATTQKAEGERENMPTQKVSAKVRALLEKHDFLELTPHGKLHCAITGHDMVTSVAAVREHLDSKKFARARASSAFDFASLEPTILPYRDAPDTKLFCRATRTVILRDARVVRNHVGGKKYQRAAPLFLEKLERLQRQAVERQKAAEEKDRRRAAAIAGEKRKRDGARAEEVAKKEADDEEEDEEEDEDEDEDEEEDFRGSLGKAECNKNKYEN